MIRTVIVGVSVAMAGLLSGCDVFGPKICESIEFEVTGGTSPVISWQPECKLHELAVMDREWMYVFWSVDGELTPPIRYGVVPKGGTPSPPARPLHADSTYLLLGAIRDRTVTYVGQLEFTP